jgi:5'-3' exonuclease
LFVDIHASLYTALVNEEGVMVEIFKSKERVADMARPRRLLFTAIGESETLYYMNIVNPSLLDDKAPRAEMNQ